MVEAGESEYSGLLKTRNLLIFRGSLSGFMNMANQIGGMITVSLTPFLADRFGWNTGFYVAAAIAGLGAIAWLLVNPEVSLSTSSRNSLI